jgi:MarR family transcriptional regulator, negative regulator of the multidrug operon emrRAB
MPPRLETLEASLERLRARVPKVSVRRLLLSRLLIEAGRGISTLLERQVRPFGLTEAEFRVLSVLFSQPDGVAHPSELCARTGQSPANMSRISDALVDRGLITRVSSVHDRRRQVLRITEEGEKFVRDLLPKMHVPLRRMLEDFSESEQRLMCAQLKKLGAELDRMDISALTEPAL